MNALQTTMTHNADRRLKCEHDRSNISFTDKNGLALAERMHRLCNVPNDAGLPEARRELAKSTSKSRDCAIIGNLLQERAQPVSYTHLTLPTTPYV